MRRARGRREPPPPPEPGSARGVAIGLLGRRDYTRAELRKRLIARRHPADEVDETLTRLVEERWLDDRRVAQAHVRTSARVKGRGRYRIARELQARGLDADLVHDAASVISADDELAAIQRVLARKRPTARPTPQERRKLFAHLLRRGFSAEMISKALRTKVPEDDDSE